MHLIKKSALMLAISSASLALAQEEKMEELVVISQQQTFANSLVSESMIDQQNAITSVLGVIDNVPGVLINEGDVFGSDDWSTVVSIRGFQLSLDEQQIGMTVDGVPNGNSNYGGGSKANRFIDTENLETVEVSQGTADISSRSHEALGGTLNFVTQDPREEQVARVSYTAGDYDAKKMYFRYDTGRFLNGTTKAYVSYSDMDVNAWIDQSGETTRNHIAVKAVGDYSWSDVTFYASYDDTEEDNYQRVSLSEFEANPDWDRLTGDWTGTPYVDQLYRRGWSTLRENFLTYARFDFNPMESLSFQVTPYYHKNEGRGDWLPPYIVDVTDDGAGQPHSELDSSNGTVRGGSALGQIGYVARDGSPLVPASDCSSLTFPYGGTGDGSLHLDPACFDTDAVPLGSYRHTHYEKERVGLTGDIRWDMDFSIGTNSVRGGFWYEDQVRYESRDWHKVIDSRTSYHFDHTPYWVQYDREYPQSTTMLYVEDALTLASVTLRAGVKQWYVDVEREDNIEGDVAKTSVSSDSDPLFSAGVLWQAVDGLEFFAGYAENFAAVKDVVLEEANLIENPDALDSVVPETATNMDLGVRYNSDRFALTATVYEIDFDNRITALSSAEAGEIIDYLGESDVVFVNAGGIKSTGFEFGGTWFVNDAFSIYSALTKNESEYQDSINDAFPNGNTVFGSPEDMFVLSFDWSEDAYRAGLSSKYVGERWIDAANTQRADAFTVTDLYFAIAGDGFGDAQGYEVKLTVNNLFDEDYLGGISGGWGAWIGGGRTAAITFTLDI